MEHTKISAEKGAVVTDEDKVLIAASATIPLFHFKLWVYRNLTEVLVYPHCPGIWKLGSCIEESSRDANDNINIY